MLRRLEEEDFRLPEMAQLRMLLTVSSTEWTYQDLMQVHDARILSRMLGLVLGSYPGSYV